MYRVIVDFSDKAWAIKEFKTKKECKAWIAAINKKYSKTPVIKIRIKKVKDA